MEARAGTECNGKTVHLLASPRRGVSSRRSGSHQSPSESKPVMAISLSVGFICVADFNGSRGLLEGSAFDCSTSKSEVVVQCGVEQNQDFQILYTGHHHVPLESHFANHLAFLNLSFLICKMGII